MTFKAWFVWILAAALIAALIAAPSAAQSAAALGAGERGAAEPGGALRRGVGTLVVAHGGDSGWNAGVLAAASEAGTGGPVEVAFLMGPAARAHRFQDQLRKLDSAGVASIVIVPMLVSSHSGHFDQIRWLAGEPVMLDSAMEHHLHMAGVTRAQISATIRVARALDDAAELAEILSERASALVSNPKERALFLIAHGPNSAEDHAAWMTNLRSVAAAVQKKTGFRDVKVDLVRDDAPAPVRAEAVKRIREVIVLQAQNTRADVAVVPVLISRGAVGDQKFRNDLAGLPVMYSGDPILPHPLVARWVERRVRETATAPLSTSPPRRFAPP
jgi:sirohydrochlorin cobaltochelatase